MAISLEKKGMPHHAPPPTKFGPLGTAQAKLAGMAARPVHAPPPTRFGAAGAAQAKPRPTPPSSTVQCSDWRTNAINTEFQSAKTSTMDSGHHKISKTKLENFYQALSPSDKLKITTIQNPTATAPMGGKGVKSLGSLIKFGPNSGKIIGDPGDNPDPTYDSSGNMTPRSKEWIEVGDIVEAAKLRGYSGITKKEVTNVVKHITEAENVHTKKIGGRILDTDTSMWTPDAGGKFKQAKPKPIATSFSSYFIGAILFSIVVAIIYQLLYRTEK